MTDYKKEIIDKLDKLLAQKQQNKPSKPLKQKATIGQIESFKARLERLEPQFKRAIMDKNLSDAKIIISDLQQVLRSLNKTTKLVELKNQLFELALEVQEYDFAIDGFLSNRTLVKNTTRLHLEATALLAITYLRISQIEKAKPFIREVLQNDKVIKTEATRIKFNREIIARFDEECALFSLKTSDNLELNTEELHTQVIKLLNSSTDEQLYIAIGKSLPKLTKDILFEVDSFSKKLLPFKEQKLLLQPEEIIKDEQAGRTVFSAFKRVVYKSLCDPTSEVYKAWYTNVAGSVVDKKYITAAVGLALTGQGIGVIALAISASVLVLRFGLDIYCERYKPTGVTELRRKAD
jgi:tetratricopeptide (TPR) repeat protein